MGNHHLRELDATLRYSPGLCLYCLVHCQEFTGLLKDHGILISMGGNGCWKSVKYEEAYLHAYDTVSVAKQGLAHYVTFYNQRRPHSAFDRKTPDEFYYENLPMLHHAA